MNPITLPIAELKPALAGLSKVIHSRSSPVLQCIKLERTTEGWIALTTTDLDHFITVRLEQPSQGKPLAILVPFEVLANLVKNSSKGDTFDLLPNPENHNVSLGRNQGSLQSVKSLPIADFPAVPKIDAPPIPLPAQLRHSIHEAMSCTSDDPTRLILHGAFIDVQQPKAHYVVATDGRHLYSSNSFHLALKESVLIPKHKFLAWREFNNDGEWQLKECPQWVQLSSRRWRFISKQIEGAYPRWRAVLPDPQQAKTHLTIDPQTLEALIQTIEKLPCHNEQYHTIGLEFKDQRLHLLTKPTHEDPWTGTTVKILKAEGKDITVYLDRLLLQKALGFGLNTIGIIDEISPLRFTNEGKQMIVMPLRPDQISHRSTPAPVSRPRVPIPSKPIMPPPPPDQPLTMDAVIDAVHHVRESFISGLNKLRDLGLQLKHLQREQKSSSRELNTVRSTLRSLQSLKL